MKLADILLWTFSLTLGVLGIIFGFMAQRNSSKANAKIKELISSSWVLDESQKIFFDNIKSVSMSNKACIDLLQPEKDITFQRYATHAAQGRLIPISNQIMEIIKDTEFRDIAQTYVHTKRALDEMFVKTVGGDFSILSSDKVISKKMKKDLVKYHHLVVENATAIIKTYNHIIRITNEVPLK